VAAIPTEGKWTDNQGVDAAMVFCIESICLHQAFSHAGMGLGTGLGPLRAWLPPLKIVLGKVFHHVPDQVAGIPDRFLIHNGTGFDRMGLGFWFALSPILKMTDILPVLQQGHLKTSYPYFFAS